MIGLFILRIISVENTQLEKMYQINHRVRV